MSLSWMINTSHGPFQLFGPASIVRLNSRWSTFSLDVFLSPPITIRALLSFVPWCYDCANVFNRLSSMHYTCLAHRHDTPYLLLSRKSRHWVDTHEQRNGVVAESGFWRRPFGMFVVFFSFNFLTFAVSNWPLGQPHFFKVLVIRALNQYLYHHRLSLCDAICPAWLRAYDEEDNSLGTKVGGCGLCLLEHIVKRYPQLSWP